MNEANLRKPRRLMLYVPAAIVLVLALLWTGGWFFAANRAEAVMNAWMEREAANGRTYECAERKVGGYPFRIEVRCSAPSVTLAEERVVLKLRDLVAVAQIYQPDLVIAEATGPMQVSLESGQQIYTADWSLLRASVRGRPNAPQRVSIVVDAPKLSQPGGTETIVARAQRLEFHVRRNPDAPDSDPAFDIAFTLAGALAPVIPALAERPLDGQATAVLRGVRDFAPKPFEQRLRDWQAAGGKLELTQARFTQGDALAIAKGAVGLSAQGRLDGTINLALAGLDQLVGVILGQSGQGRMGGLLAGLAALGRTEIEGKRAMSLPVQFKDGRVFVGPVPVGQLAPLY